MLPAILRVWRTAKPIVGIGLCAYEGAALAANNPDALPRLTDLAHRYPWLGRTAALWCVVHLALPMLWPWMLRASLQLRLTVRRDAA